MIREDGTSTISVRRDNEAHATDDSNAELSVSTLGNNVVFRMGSASLTIPARAALSFRDMLGYAMGPAPKSEVDNG